MAIKYKLKLKDLKLQYLIDYFKPILNYFKPKQKIKDYRDLKNFIKKKSAWVSQVMNNDENRMRHHQAHLHTILNLAAGDTIELICYGTILSNDLYISNDASGVKSNFLSGYKLIL